MSVEWVAFGLRWCRLRCSSSACATRLVSTQRPAITRMFGKSGPSIAASNRHTAWVQGLTTPRAGGFGRRHHV